MVDDHIGHSRWSNSSIVYALFGGADHQRLDAWRATWLSGRKFVYLPDRPVGPFAAHYRPVHVGRAGVDFLARTPVDANMLWGVYEANLTHPTAAWVFIGDSDAFVFPIEVERQASHHDPRRRIVLGWYPQGSPEPRLWLRQYVRPGVADVAQPPCTPSHRTPSHCAAPRVRPGT